MRCVPVSFVMCLFVLFGVCVLLCVFCIVCVLCVVCVCCVIVGFVFGMYVWNTCVVWM